MCSESLTDHVIGLSFDWVSMCMFRLLVNENRLLQIPRKYGVSFV
jgi:hypothetical protein